MMLQCRAGPALGYNRLLVNDFAINIWLFYDPSLSVSPGRPRWAASRRHQCLHAHRGLVYLFLNGKLTAA